jgi:hypothetical protein
MIPNSWRHLLLKQELIDEQRHILVKGCGKSPTIGASNANGDSQSPVDKSEVMSDSTEDNSPEMMKKEL